MNVFRDERGIKSIILLWNDLGFKNMISLLLVDDFMHQISVDSHLETAWAMKNTRFYDVCSSLLA